MMDFVREALEKAKAVETNELNELSTFLQKVLSKKIGLMVKEVKAQTNISGVIYVPKSIVGETVIILKLNKENEDKDENQGGNTPG